MGPPEPDFQGPLAPEISDNLVFRTWSDTPGIVYSAILAKITLWYSGESLEDPDGEGRHGWRPACPVAVAKHRRPVVFVMAVEEFERLKVLNLQGVPMGNSAIRNSGAEKNKS